jgi:hypothetical protein
VLVELGITTREMRGDGGNPQKKPELKIISFVIQFTIPDTAGMTYYPPGKNPSTGFSTSNQASYISDISSPLVFFISFPNSSPNSLLYLELCHCH